MKPLFAILAAFLLAACAGVGVQLFLNSGSDNSLAQPNQKTAPRARAPLDVINSAAGELTRLAQAEVTSWSSHQAASLLNKIEVSFAALQQDERANDSDVAQARHALLIARYESATIDRSRFGKPFDEYAQQLISENPESELACQAKILQLLARHDLRRPVDRRLRIDLEEFVADHTPEQGTMLYCLASRELVRHDQPDSAKTVLQHGIKAYQSTPAAVFVLVNKSADLELSQAPPPQDTQAQYESMMRSYEARAEAAVNKSRPARKSCSSRRS